MSYPLLNTVNATNDVSTILVYANNLTGGAMMPMFLFLFFWIVCLGSYFAQKRFDVYASFPISFATAGFTTFGLAAIMSMKNGLLNPMYLIISIAVTVIGVLWLYMSTD